MARRRFLATAGALALLCGLAAWSPRADAAASQMQGVIVDCTAPPAQVTTPYGNVAINSQGLFCGSVSGGSGGGATSAPIGGAVAASSSLMGGSYKVTPTPFPTDGQYPVALGNYGMMVMCLGGLADGKCIDPATPSHVIVDSGQVNGSTAPLCSLAIKATATACGTSAAHQVYYIAAGNAANTLPSYLQVFNKAAGSVVLGTDVPLQHYELPAGLGRNVGPAVPIAFSTAFTLACTTTPTGNVAPVNSCTADVLGN